MFTVIPGLRFDRYLTAVVYAVAAIRRSVACALSSNLETRQFRIFCQDYKMNAQ